MKQAPLYRNGAKRNFENVSGAHSGSMFSLGGLACLVSDSAAGQVAGDSLRPDDPQANSGFLRKAGNPWHRKAQGVLKSPRVTTIAG